MYVPRWGGGGYSGYFCWVCTTLRIPYPIIVDFGAILKTRPSLFGKKKPFSQYQLTFCLCIYLVKPFNLAILKWTDYFVKGAQSWLAHSHWVSHNKLILSWSQLHSPPYWILKVSTKISKSYRVFTFFTSLSTQGETTDNNKSVFRRFNVV